MDTNNETIDHFREEEEKKKFVEKFKKTYDDWETKKKAVTDSYNSYKEIKDDPIKLEELFKKLGIKNKGELWPKITKMNRPEHLHPDLWWQWLKFLGYIMPHKPKKQAAPEEHLEKQEEVINLSALRDYDPDNKPEDAPIERIIIGDWPMCLKPKNVLQLVSEEERSKIITRFERSRTKAPKDNTPPVEDLFNTTEQ